MAPGDVCHGPRCSLAGLRPVALEYCSCHWPAGSARSPQCVRPMGCWFFPVPRPPYVCVSPRPLGSYSPVCPLAVLRCVCGVLGHLAPVHRCARSVRCFACAVSWPTWFLFTGVPAWFVALRLRCPGLLGSCSPVRPLRVLCCVWRVLFTGVPARCAALCVRCPGPFGSCSPLCEAVLSYPFVVLGACACAVSWPTWRLFTGVRAVCGAHVPLVVVSLFPPPQIFFCLPDPESLTPTRKATQQSVPCESLTPTPRATPQSVDLDSPKPTRGAKQQSVNCEFITPNPQATQQSLDCESLILTQKTTQQSVDCEFLTPTEGATQQRVN